MSQIGLKFAKYSIRTLIFHQTAPYKSF